MTTQEKTRLVALYGRQSKDEPDGIQRQIKRCTALIQARGWTLVDTYLDDDTTASKTRGAKTAWARMLADAAADRIDTVVSVDLDRLLRSTRDLNTLIDHGLMAVTVDGEIDLASADGEFRATMLAGIARFEVRRKGERQKRGNEQRAKKGIPLYRGRRFGYLGKDAATGRAANVELDPVEAELIREAARRVLAGGSAPGAGEGLAAVARQWREDGVPTVYEGRWAPAAVRNILTNPYLAGIASYNGEPVGVPGVQEPIFDVDTHRALVSLFDRRVAGPRKQGAPVRTLLSNIATCGKCGAHVIGIRDGRGNPLYRCSNTAHLARQREPIDALVRAVVVHLLQRPDAAELVRDKQRMERMAALRSRAKSLTDKLDEIADMFAEDELTREQASRLTASTRDKLKAIKEQMSGLVGGNVLAGIAGAPDAADQWDVMANDRQRAIIAELFTVTINGLPKGQSPKKFDETTILIEPTDRVRDMTKHPVSGA